MLVARRRATVSRAACYPPGLRALRCQHSCRSLSSAADSAVLLDDASSIIGATPLVRLTRLCAELGLEGEILAKCEQLNPGYSKKDRIALQIVEDAEAAVKRTRRG